MSSPVTVAITRTVDPSHADQMDAWVRAGSSLAERFPGFLGAGWVRGSVDAPEWHMLYRFADPAALSRWEDSDQRRWWLDSAQGLVAHTRTQKHTGIEGWFDPPTDSSVEVAPPRAPARWRQAIVIWMTFFPLSLLIGELLLHLGPPLPYEVRTLVSTVVMTPIMTYLALPWMTARFAWFLHP